MLARSARPTHVTRIVVGVTPASALIDISAPGKYDHFALRPLLPCGQPHEEEQQELRPPRRREHGTDMALLSQECGPSVLALENKV